MGGINNVKDEGEALGLIQTVREERKHFLCRRDHSVILWTFTNGPQP